MADWIPVTRELPEPNKRVLVCLEDGNIGIDWIGMYDTGFVEHKRISREMDVAKVVAWMPFPEPYRPIEEAVW